MSIIWIGVGSCSAIAVLLEKVLVNLLSNLDAPNRIPPAIRTAGSGMACLDHVDCEGTPILVRVSKGANARHSSPESQIMGGDASISFVAGCSAQLEGS